jgi:ribosomal protein S27E
MATDSPVSSFFQQFTQYRCPDCGGSSGFRSRRRTFSERYLLPFFLLQPVRCGDCFHREYRLIFTPVRKRLSEASGMLPAARAAAPPDRRNVA